MGIYQTSNNIGALAGLIFAGVLSTAFGIRYAFLAIVQIINTGYLPQLINNPNA